MYCLQADKKSMQEEVAVCSQTSKLVQVVQVKMVKARCRFCDGVEDATKMVDPCR